MNFLSDSEWSHICDIILDVNSIDDDRDFRRAILKKLRILIPYESAAFFLSDLSKDLSHTAQEWRNNANFIEPVGVDIPHEVLDEYTYRYYHFDYMGKRSLKNAPKTYRESDFMDKEELESEYYVEHLQQRFVLNCSFLSEEGYLGSMNLNRLKKDGDFSDKEVQILEILQPHIFNRLKKWHLVARHSSAETVFIHDYNISARESDVVRCVLQGMSNAEISEELSISQGTVKKHLENVFQKTSVHSRVELTALLNAYTSPESSKWREKLSHEKKRTARA